MNLLIKHHLIAGWRNILKYKTQNLISVVSLSVGTLLFAIVLWFANFLWQSVIHSEWESHAIHVEFYESELDYEQLQEQKSDSLWHYRRSTIDVVKKLQQCKAVDELRWNSYRSYYTLVIKDLKGKEYTQEEIPVRMVSPNYLKLGHYRSALTDEEYGILKPGTIIISSRVRDQIFGKGVNPVGYEISTFVNYKRINDVFDSKGVDGDGEGILVVLDDEPLEQKGYDVDGREIISWYDEYADEIKVSLKDGYSQEELEKEGAQKMPQYKMHVFGRSNDIPRGIVILLIGLLIFLGASVLLIGLSGYLKMQIQLFNLRSREMALRRCNGAKPAHLFILLACELLIIFAFVWFGSILVTMCVADYALPKLNLLGFDVDRYSFDIKDIFGVEALITLGTFLVSLMIAWWSVRKVVRVPLGMTAGKSYKPRTFWGATMQVIQYFVATILFFCIVGIFWAIQHETFEFQTLNKPDFYEEIVDLHGMDLDGLERLPSVEHVGRIYYRVYPVVTEELDTAGMSDMRDKDRVVQTCILDAGTLKRLNMKVKEKMADDGDTLSQYGLEDYTIPVCAEMEEAEAVAKLLGVKFDASRIMVAGMKRCVLLGYLPLLDTRRANGLNPIASYMVYPRLGYEETQRAILDTYEEYPVDVLIFPKEDRYHDALEDVREMVHEVHPEISENAKIAFSAHDALFRELLMIRLVSQLCLLLVLVSLCSIILSVYSSVSLETRGRQKEVAIRKVHGAKTRDIVVLFSKYYVRTLIIAFVITAVFALAIFLAISISAGFPDGDESLNILYYFSIPYLTSIAVITLVTFLTIWQKIYQVAHMNAALMVKKE